MDQPLRGIAMKFITLCFFFILARTILAEPTPKNVILFIGDGMGAKQIEAAQNYFNGLTPLQLTQSESQGWMTSASCFAQNAVLTVPLTSSTDSPSSAVLMLPPVTRQAQSTTLARSLGVLPGTRMMCKLCRYSGGE